MSPLLVITLLLSLLLVVFDLALPIIEVIAATRAAVKFGSAAMAAVAAETVSAAIICADAAK